MDLCTRKQGAGRGGPARGGVAILSSDVFVLDAGEPKNAVRIATGAARDQQELRNALGAVVELLLSTSGLGIVQT
jgi:hypothetical protein